MRQRLEREVPIRFGLLIVIVIFVKLSATNAYSFHNTHLTNPYVVGGGFVAFILGLLFAIWARRNLGENWGMPMTVKQSPELVTSGPYRFVRHPIYSGILLAMLGTAFATTLIGLFILAIVGTYFIYSALVEEKIMLAAFPKTYPAYKQKTKMIIPFIL